MEKEFWLPVVGYEGYYEVSSLGRIKSLERKIKILPNFSRVQQEKFLQTSGIHNKYTEVGLCINGVRKSVKVHQVVAMAFLNHNPCGQEVVIDHINSIKSDNRLSNIRLVTGRFNTTKDIIKNSGLSTGVSFDDRIPRKKFKSLIRSGKFNIFLGCFDTNAEAHRQYLIAVENIYKFTGDKKAFRELVNSL